MAQQEKIMAEGTPSGPEIAPTGPQAGPGEQIPQRPWHFSAEYDPKRVGEYRVTEKDRYKIFTDLVTGREVARVLRIEGGALPVPETELNPEGKSPDDVVDIMLTIDNMESEKRETFAPQFQKAVDVLLEYTKDSKLLGLGWQVSDLKQELRKDEQKMIDQAEQANPGNGERLLDLLSQLDTAERFLENYDKNFASHEYDNLADEDELKEFQIRQAKYQSDKVELRKEIDDLVKDSKFLPGRDKQKKNIAVREAELEKLKEEQRIAEAQKRSTEQSPLEKSLEKRLLTGEHPGNVPHADTFTEQMNLYNQQSTADVERGLSWYFHEGRNRGLFDSLDKDLRQKYIEWSNSLTPRRELSQLGMAEGFGGRIVSKSYPEVEREIIAYFKDLLAPNNPGFVEDDVQWEKFERRGLSTQDRQMFSRIRIEYMRRAQAQVIDALENFDRQRNNQPLVNLPHRISGEWNVHMLQQEMRIIAARQALEAQAEPLYERESYYRINLKGRNRQEIELGADQAAEDIMRSFNDFDFDAIKIRIQTLSEAIQGRRELIRVTEGNISESDAQAIIDSIKDRIENKVGFHLMSWAGGNLQMSLFTGLLGRYVQSRGCERLKEFPAMANGLVGIATKLLLSRKYRMHYRPQGWRGQMKDEDTAHKFLRDNIQGKIAAVLMEYELKEGNAREKLTQVHSWEDFMNNFHHKGLITISGIDDAYKVNQLVVDLNNRGYKHLILEQYMKLIPQNMLLSVPDLDHPGQFKPGKILPPEEYKKIEPYLTVVQRSSYRDDYYVYILDQLQRKGAGMTVEDLDSLREAREARVSAYIDFQNAKERASTAVTIANQFLDNWGESAELGDPSVIMENGHFMSIGEVRLVLKFAVLEAGAAERVSDSLLNRRERSNAWLRKVIRMGNDRSRVPESSCSFQVTLPAGEKVTIRLAKGFEETGLTQHQWNKLKEAWALLNKNGYLAVINGVKIQDIIKRENLKPLKNNYLADYKSSMSQINSPKVRDEVARGRLPIIKNILVRLGFKDRQTIDGVTQREIDQYTQLIEDSRSFDARIDELVYYLATHPAIERTADGEYPVFNPDALDFGFQNLNWGVKRLRHLRGFWLTNLNRTVARGADMMYWMPTIDRLAGEMDFENILDLAFNVNTAANGMESVDNPALIQFANRLDNLVFIRGKGEGSIGKGEGGMDKDWGWNEKWMVDANNAVKAIEGIGTSKDALRKYLDEATNQKIEAEPFGLDQAEKWVDAITTTLGRLKPLLVGNEALLGENRQALSAGAGYEDNMLMIFRYSEWMRSKKGGSRREQGGSVVQEEIEDILQLLMTPSTFIPGRKYKLLIEKKNGVNQAIRNNKTVIFEESPSIWEEAMRKLTPSHNPGLPDREQTYAFKLIKQIT